MYDFDNMSREEDQSFFVSFSKAQFSLLHVLSENFGTHEKQSIGDHDLAVLVEKYQREYSEQWDAKFGFFPFKEGWSPTNWMTTRLPFGHMCLQTIARKYDDTGVTDAISKYNAYLVTKTFTPFNISTWISNLEHAWSQWWNHTDPDLASVEILVTDNDDWKAWVFTFSNAHGDKATPSPRSEGQATSLIAGFAVNTTMKARSLIAGFGINRDKKLQKRNNHKEDKQSKQKKRCLKKGCTNYVAKHFHKYK